MLGGLQSILLHDIWPLYAIFSSTNGTQLFEMIPSVEMGKKVTDNYDIIPNDVKEKTVLSAAV